MYYDKPIKEGVIFGTKKFRDIEISAQKNEGNDLN
jgi:hypothetical protein